MGEELGETLYVLGWSLWQYAMPKIEYKASAGERPTKFIQGAFEGITAHEQEHGVEISLNRCERLQFLAGIARRYRRIDADRIDPRFGDIALV